LFYAEDDFLKKKQKSISTIEKYMLLGKSCMAFAPFLGIIQMVLSGAHQITGRQMAVSGLLLALYICFEMKKPSVSPSEENYAVELINQYYNHEDLVKIFGPDV